MDPEKLIKNSQFSRKWKIANFEKPHLSGNSATRYLLPATCDAAKVASKAAHARAAAIFVLLEKLKL